MKPAHNRRPHGWYCFLFSYAAHAHLSARHAFGGSCISTKPAVLDGAPANSLPSLNGGIAGARRATAASLRPITLKLAALAGAAGESGSCCARIERADKSASAEAQPRIMCGGVRVNRRARKRQRMSLAPNLAARAKLSPRRMMAGREPMPTG